MDAKLVLYPIAPEPDGRVLLNWADHGAGRPRRHGPAPAGRLEPHGFSWTS